MNKNLRSVRETIERGGGREVAVSYRRRHVFVEFTDLDGVRRSIPIHGGTNPKRYEDCLRSQLRRAGLRP